MKIVEKISRFLKLTTTEVKVFSFLILIIIAGSGYKFLFKQDKSEKLPDFDYSNDDSLFNAPGILEDNSNDKASLLPENQDYKKDVLEFNKEDFKKSEVQPLPAEKSINLNTADANKLLALPGIGIKTAQNIINYRNENGKFRSLDELENIKGIGKAKFEKIVKYLYVE